MAKQHVGCGIVNFNTATLTLRCVQSLIATSRDLRCLVLDNGSRPEDVQLFREGITGFDDASVALICAESNLGFAGGCNRLFGELLADPSVESVLLLNNDAVALPGLVVQMKQRLAVDRRIGLVGARMHRLADPEQVDTLGITLFSSLMASDRHDTEDPFLGPTGGCCLLSRVLLEELYTTTGEYFPEAFFCYWEDTDLVLRARLLGYQPAYINECLALHQGQASSGGGYNDFIAYHGLRNAMWTIIRCIPMSLLAIYGWLFLLANLMTIARYGVTGRWRLVWRIYRDALRGVPARWRERQKIQAARRIPVDELRALIAPRFYRQGYIIGVLRRMFGRR